MIKKQIVFNKVGHVEEIKKLAEECGISPLVAQILYDRKYRNKSEIFDFLQGNIEPFHDPFLMKDMEKAVIRIFSALKNHEKITIYGDYDVDGITASSLVYLFLIRMGAEVDVYIPERKSEGYGLNIEAIEKIHAKGTKLIITVDCGITGVNEVNSLPKTMDMIITDHHTPPEVLPAAYAVINPHQKDCAYPFADLAGVGVAFKLCQALAKYEHSEDNYWEELIELAAMGTVADIVPLVGENRDIVKRGLAKIKNTDIIGLQELIKVSNCADKEITSATIGFVLAPRLNAAGRLEHAMSAVDLLITDNKDTAQEIANKLNEENIKRQEISSAIFRDAELMVNNIRGTRKSLVLAKEGWHPGVIGIVASRLVDKYYLPSILISIDGEIGKGSCRSIPPLNLYEVLKECEDLLIQFGGHRQAAGLTIDKANIPAFQARFGEVVASKLTEADFIPSIIPDVIVDEENPLSIRVLNELKLLEPYGAANHSPIFAFTRATIKNCSTMGIEKNHLRMFIDNGQAVYKGIIWNQGQAIDLFYNNAETAMAFSPKINNWNGIEQIDLQIEAINLKYNVIDLRQSKQNKAFHLKNILQNSQKTVLYVNKGNKHLRQKEQKRFTVKAYGDENNDDKYERIIYYELPEMTLFNDKNKILEIAEKSEVYLLYNFNDFQRWQKKMKAVYPQREYLAQAYRELQKLLIVNGYYDIENLPLLQHNDNTFITVTTLKIFEELGFIQMDSGKLKALSTLKNDLHNSETYRNLHENYLKVTEIIRNNLETPLVGV